MSLGEMIVMALLLIGSVLIGKLLSLITGVEDGLVLYGSGFMITVVLFFLVARVAACFIYPDKDDWLYIFLRGLWAFIKKLFAERGSLTKKEKAGGYLDFRYEEER